MADHNDSSLPQAMRMGNRWDTLRFYRKSDALYQLTFVFCERFLPKHGDRTVDQMVQAARSGKQNIVEGTEDGKTSTEMELRLINVARASIGELREDYKDYIGAHGLTLWQRGHKRFQQMQDFTKSHNNATDYLPYAHRWTAEEFCNICLTLCYQCDAMINAYLRYLDKLFVTEGGIKERMYAARTGYRKGQDERMRQLEAENASLKQQVAQWSARYEDLKQRALAAYYRQQEEIKRLKAEGGEEEQ